MTVCWIDRPVPVPVPVPVAPCRRRRPAAPASPARPATPSRLARFSRRLAVALLGSLAVLAGVAMLVLPGPGLVTIALGFGILGREFTWAARVNAALRARLAATTDSVRQAVRRS